MDAEGAASPRRVAAWKRGWKQSSPAFGWNRKQKGREGGGKKERERRKGGGGRREGGGDWLPSAKEDGGGEPRLLLRCLSEITARTRFLAVKGLFATRKKKNIVCFFAKSKLPMYVIPSNEIVHLLMSCTATDTQVPLYPPPPTLHTAAAIHPSLQRRGRKGRQRRRRRWEIFPSFPPPAGEGERARELRQQ